jgi:hypothetical protein
LFIAPSPGAKSHAQVAHPTDAGPVWDPVRFLRTMCILLIALSAVLTVWALAG